MRGGCRYSCISAPETGLCFWSGGLKFKHYCVVCVVRISDIISVKLVHILGPMVRSRSGPNFKQTQTPTPKRIHALLTVKGLKAKYTQKILLLQSIENVEKIMGKII